jgi:TRAP-type C4-dicarboxylate transport system substrate-binding protein
MKWKTILGWRLVGIAMILAPLAGFPARASEDVKIIRISHQFPGGSIDKGDFRDRLVRMFAKEVEQRTDGQLKCAIYPSSSLLKTGSQFNALRKGALDMTLLPLAYAGGDVPQVNLGLMPALVDSYEQGLRWKDAPIGEALRRILEDKNIVIVTWIWQAGGIASNKKALLAPADSTGLKVRGGSKDVDIMLKGAGSAITNVPSNEIYAAMQSSVLDAAVTSSTSFISFRLQEVSRYLTAARNKTFWFMFEPLLMSKHTFDSLTPEQQKIVMDVGASLEKFGLQAAKADDQRVVEVYEKAGVKVSDMDEATFQQWRQIAAQTSWKEFAHDVPNGQNLLDMARAVE